LTTTPPLADLIRIANECKIDLMAVPRERGRSIICEAKWKGLVFNTPSDNEVDDVELAVAGRAGNTTPAT
jgi:hypothetical protein